MVLSGYDGKVLNKVVENAVGERIEILTSLFTLGLQDTTDIQMYKGNSLYRLIGK